MRIWNVSQSFATALSHGEERGNNASRQPKKRAVRLSFLCMANRKRYEVTCDSFIPCFMHFLRKRFNTASGMRSHATLVRKNANILVASIQYRKRYEVTCDTLCLGGRRNRRLKSRFWKTSSKPNGMIVHFQLSSHTHRVCDDPANPYVARLAAIRGKSENLPRFFASRRFSTFLYSSMVFHICQIYLRSKVAMGR